MNNRVRDLTTGPVYKKLILFAVPMILASFLQSVYGLIDMMITGRFCGADGLSGVYNGSMIMNLVSFVAIGLSTGGNVSIGQYYGAGDDKNRKEATSTAMGFMLIVGLVLAIALFVLARPLMRLLDAPALEEAVAYLRICAIGCIFIYGYNGLCAIIRAVGDSRTPLLIIVVAAVSNVVLDLLCIAVFEMGVIGAAIATVFSQFVSFLLALIHTQQRASFFGFTIFKLKIYRDKLKLILKIGVPSAFLFCVNGFTHLLNTSLMNGYGVVVSAGCGVGNRIVDLGTGFITATMSASSTMVAQCIGAKLYDRVRRVLRATLILNLCIGAVVLLLVQLFAPGIISLFEKSAEVIDAGVHYLRVVIFQPFIYSFFTSLHAVATGAGDTKLVMWNSIFGMALPRIVLALLLNGLIGIVGVYLSCILAPLFAIPVALWYYKKNRWQHRMIN